jgi:hypothetical protein
MGEELEGEGEMFFPPFLAPLCPLRHPDKEKESASRLAWPFTGMTFAVNPAEALILMG